MSETSFHNQFGLNQGLQLGQNFGNIYYNTGVSAETCHQLFRLVDKREGFEWYKDNIENRVQGTCEWFLTHPHYLAWKKARSGPLLVSADPGCGKSVLAKHLIDHELSGVCYFFFKDQVQDRLQQALCAVLHQLFTLRPPLLRHAVEAYRKNGEKLVEINSILWEILHSCIRDRGSQGITFVFDALDECRRADLKDLIQNVQRVYCEDCRVKFFLTSRPYRSIIFEFWELKDAFPEIEIPGDQYSEQISNEVNIVSLYRVNQLSKKFALKAEVKSRLEQKLLQVPHRTYLWIHLVMATLEDGFRISKTVSAINHFIDTLPPGIDKAYEKILARTTDEEKARRTFAVILAAERPLKLAELNLAVNVTGTRIEDLDLEDDSDFENSLRDWCGLFVTVNQEKVYFLHQTAREFLLNPRDDADVWQGSIRLVAAHATLADICLRYLDLKEFQQYREHAPEEANPKYALLPYASRNWTEHFRKAGSTLEAATINLGVKSCRVKGCYPLWLRISQPTHLSKQIGLSTLIIASSFGLDRIVELLDTTDINHRDGRGLTALSYASYYGYAEVVRKLLANGAFVNSRSVSGGTALCNAAKEQHLDVVGLLILHRADVNIGGLSGRTALHQVARNGNEAIAWLLLDAGVDLEIPDEDKRTALHVAVENLNTAVVQLLLRRGARINILDVFGYTPLARSVLLSQEEIVTLLLKHGADVNIAGLYDERVLHIAARRPKRRILEMLLTHGAKVNAQDAYEQTALHEAALFWRPANVELLLRYKATVNPIADGKTPLQLAIEEKDELNTRLVELSYRIEGDNESRLTVQDQARQTMNLLLAYGGKTEVTALENLSLYLN